MNQSYLERKLPFYYWLIILSCIALLFFFFTKSQTNNNNELKALSSGITKLINLNSQLSDAVVQNFSGLTNHYDKLVYSFDQLEKSSLLFFSQDYLLT